MKTSAKKFIVGKSYSATSACDSNCVFTWTVTKRTEKFITVEQYGETTRRGVKINTDGIEYCYAAGSYSMAPTIWANEPNERSPGEVSAAVADIAADMMRTAEESKAWEAAEAEDEAEANAAAAEAEAMELEEAVAAEIVSIVIVSESPQVDSDGTIVATIAEAEAVLRLIALNRKPGGGSDKTFFRITMLDGDVYEGRIDVRYINCRQETLSGKLGLLEHIIGQYQWYVRGEGFNAWGNTAEKRESLTRWARRLGAV